MPITRPSNFLTAKVNIQAVGNRLNEATAEDYVGAGNPNPTYGVYTSLALLQSTYPSAVAGAYAIIDSGVGSNPQIALWDATDTVWVLQQTSATTTAKTYIVGDDVTDIRVTDINGYPYIIVSGTYEGPNKDKLESYSANSYTRAL